jgi:hypothetical protein
MNLGEKQRLFTYLQAKLVIYAYEELGVALTVGDAYRDPRSHGDYGVKKEGIYGRTKSNHKRRLAMDFNLFFQLDDKWVYQRTSAAFQELGNYWESLHELCSWGGRFNDGNHFSLMHQGMR